jgi:Holliday junction resolvase YEN1
MCGAVVVHQLAHTGLGNWLLTAAETLSPKALDVFLLGWQVDLRHELCHNTHGCLSRKHLALANNIPEEFPDCKILFYYVTPLTSWSNGPSPTFTFDPRLPDIGSLITFCRRRFSWGSTLSSVHKTFTNVLWDPLFKQIVCKVSDFFHRMSTINLTSHILGFFSTRASLTVQHIPRTCYSQHTACQWA